MEDNKAHYKIVTYIQDLRYAIIWITFICILETGHKLVTLLLVSVKRSILLYHFYLHWSGKQSIALYREDISPLQLHIFMQKLT
jgi:hypothetical protein